MSDICLVCFFLRSEVQLSQQVRRFANGRRPGRGGRGRVNNNKTRPEKTRGGENDKLQEKEKKISHSLLKKKKKTETSFHTKWL